MQKEDFEKKLCKKVSADEYEAIETVYLYYPGFKNHTDIVSVFRIGGMLLISDLLTRARRIELAEERVTTAKAELEKLQKYDG